MIDTPKPHLLQLAPFMPLLEDGLTAQFEVHRLFDMPDPEAWFAQHGEVIVAVATGGNIGIPNEWAKRLPRLQIVAINGVGIDKVDTELARNRGYRVTNTPDVLTDDVADLAIGLSIALLRGVVGGHKIVSSNNWPDCELPLGRKITGRSVGILGLGRIGQAIAKRFEAFDAKIGYVDTVDCSVTYTRYPNPVSLAAASDILVVATAATPDNEKIVDRQVIDALGPRGYLVNIARGSLVDEQALIDALREQRLGGAALDVFMAEPFVPVELQQMPNVILTPHIASATFDTREAMARLVLDNLHAHFTNQPLLTVVV